MSYLVTDLDVAKRTARLRRQDVTYYTQVCVCVRVCVLLDEDDSSGRPRGPLSARIL